MPWKSNRTFSFEGRNIGFRKKVTTPAIEGAIIVLAMMISEAAPYSPEVARFEWHIDLARQAQYEQPNAAQLKPLALLGEVSEEQQPALVLHLKQGCRSFDSSYAVFDLFRAIQTGQFEQLNINQLQQGVISIQANGEALCHALDADVFQLLQCLEQKQSLSEIPEVLLAHLNSIMALDLIDGFTLKSI